MPSASNAWMGGMNSPRGIRPVQWGDHWATTDHEPLISSRSNGRRSARFTNGMATLQIASCKFQAALSLCQQSRAKQSFQHWVASRVHRVVDGFFHTGHQGRTISEHRTQGAPPRGTGHPPTTPKNPFFLRAHMLPSSSRQDGTACLQIQPTPPNGMHHEPRNQTPDQLPSQQNQPGFPCQASNDALFSQQTG